MDEVLYSNEDFLAPLDGFTYYPNATSVHSRTYPSIAYLLTGNMCYFDNQPWDYVNAAYENSSFIPALCENQIDVGLYTFSYYLGDSVKMQMCNYVFEKIELDFGEVVRLCGKMALYRDMPYFTKKRFEYDVAEINRRVIKEDSSDEVIENESAPPYQNFQDEWFYETLTQEGLDIGEENGCFRFYHLASCHNNLSDPVPSAIRSFEIIYDYLDKMRKLGVYKDSLVIITTDHGSSGEGDTLDMPHETAVPILFVKPAGAADEVIRVSNAPVSHTDFIPTILDGFSLDYEEFGRTFYDIPEEEDRERFYYYTALYAHKEGEIELREYSVDGDARNKENYHFTGNKWDVLYSYNKVASSP